MRYSFLMGLTLFGPVSCAERTPAATSVSGTWFNCENGTIFSTERSGPQLVLVVADGRRFELAAAPTAFGELFQAEDTILRIDEEFAVLAGGPVRDYTRCRLMNGGTPAAEQAV